MDWWLEIIIKLIFLSYETTFICIVLKGQKKYNKLYVLYGSTVTSIVTSNAIIALIYVSDGNIIMGEVIMIVSSKLKA